MKKTKFGIFGTALATLMLVNAIDLPLSTNVAGTQVDLTTEAVARSSGGRSRSGSFRRSTPSRSNSSPSRSNNSSPSRSNNSPSYRNDPYYRQPGPVVVPVPVPGGSTYNNNYNNNYRSGSSSTSSEASTGDVILGLIILLIIGGVSIFVLWWVISSLIKATRGSTAGGAVSNREMENDTVTVTKLQVALLASARDVQSRLNELSLSIDTDTPEGMAELLQESALALLRTPENWSHAATSSQIVKNREQAEALFNQLSVAERSKFSAETLVNVGGKVRRQNMVAPGEDETAAYIVVTLLIGTEHDKPLVGAIHSTQELQTALEKIAALPPETLAVFELLWSPQDENDSLTYDELLTEYTDMIQIA